MGGGREPERTCVGCRARASKGGLLRVVRSPGGEIRADPTGRAPGRGAYVHADAACVERAWRSRALSRALRAPLDEEGAASLVRDLMRTGVR